MHIVICGSLAFHKRMQTVRDRLIAAGHTAVIPGSTVEVPDGRQFTTAEWYRFKKADGSFDLEWVRERKASAMRAYLNEVAASDAILVLNYAKSGIRGYIGGNTLVEMGVAFQAGKPIFLWNDPPAMAYTEEILGMRPIVLRGRLDALTGRDARAA